jgi:hypothetical protein
MNKRGRLRLAVTAAALAAVVAHHLWPDFKADAFTGILLVVAALPWLAPILKSIKLPGGLEVELRELRAELDQTKGAVKSAALQAQVGAALRAPAPASNGAPVASRAAEAPREALLALGEKYAAIRHDMPSGFRRTELATRVLAEMFKEADALEALELRPLLTSTSAAERLAGIAYAHQHPSPDNAAALVDALLHTEGTPFGQYWALRALRRIAEVDRRVFRGELRTKLIDYRRRQKPGTDRYYEATQLLRDLRRPDASSVGLQPET